MVGCVLGEVQSRLITRRQHVEMIIKVEHDLGMHGYRSVGIAN